MTGRLRRLWGGGGAWVGRGERRVRELQPRREFCCNAPNGSISPFRTKNFKTDWKAGSSWRLVFPNSQVADTGGIVEIEKPRRVVLKWRNEFSRELHEEDSARCVSEIYAATY
jgi:hypothetical protein